MAAAVAASVSSLPALLSFTANASVTRIEYAISQELFAAPIQLTLNLCNAPSPYNQSDRSIFTAFTNSSFTYGKSIRGGFANMTIPVTKQDQTLTVALDIGNDDSQDYTFELGITAKPDLPWHSLDKLPLFAYEDSDNATALFTSPTYASNGTEGPPAYEPVVLLTENVRADLGNSTCYIRSLQGAGSITNTTTTRGVVELTLEEGGYSDEIYQEGRKVQYMMSELDVASNYSVWGIAETDEGGSRLYQRQYFATKQGELGSTKSPLSHGSQTDRPSGLTDDRCRLVLDVPFCPDIAYSVPAPPSMSTDDLLDLYEASISPIMSNFNLTVSTFPCDGELRRKQGMYSPVRTCDQCISAYRSWLCSIRMPRCTDYDPSPSTDERDIRTFPHTSAEDSRTPTLPNDAFPYSEVPPCIDVCSLVRASCPPLISTPFQCPLEGITMNQSYATPFVEQIAFSNVQGGDDPAWMKHAIKDAKDDFVTRAKDRWGNVRCNDMGVLNLVERRKWSGLPKP